MFSQHSGAVSHRAFAAIPLPRAALLLLATLTLFACASSRGAEPGIATEPPRAPLPGDTTHAWRIRSWENLDIWLHGFALMERDSSRVPFFHAGYAREIDRYKASRSLRTKFDDNEAKLLERFSSSRALWNAQFLGLYFGSWKEMKEFMNYFILTDGDPRRASNGAMQRAIAIIAGYFRTVGDRDWARLYMESLEDEYDRYYHEWWTAESARRRPAFEAVDSLWRMVYYPKFKRFLDGTQQRRGDILLSIPLGGEGRLVPGGVNSPAGNHSYLAINFPDSRDRAIEAIYVLTHELVGRVTSVAVDDHTTPAEDRSGLKASYDADALVVGGFYLLRKIAPDIADGYARYYAQMAGLSVGNGSAEASINVLFPLPQLIRESIIRQIDLVLSGI